MKAINLLPPDLRGAPRRAASQVAAGPDTGGTGAFAVLGVLAVCVLALAAYVLTTNTVKDREAKLASATAEAQATTQRVAELKPYADFKAMAETRIQTVRDLASSRFDFEQALRDVSRAIPADVTLTDLNGTVSSSSGGSGVRSAIAAPAIELKGCTTSQKQVATLLSRLRNVDGVTRVSLGKSLKPEATAAAPATGVPGGGTQTAGCGASKGPQFEIVMFFESSEVPATVEDITVQTGAASEQSAAPGQQPSDAATPPADPAATPAPAATPQGASSP
jgi:Tfp pilus assembly protein PilN